MHREKLVVLLFAANNLQAWSRQLSADDQGHHTSDHEIDKGGNQVKVADFLVVGGG